MSSRLPADARRVLDEGQFCHLATRTDAGPHLTPLVFVLERGRIWVTTSRRSVKARAWKSDPAVAGLVRSGNRAVTFRGRVRTFDALDPLSWPGAAARGPAIASAAVRFSVKNARFFAGYAADARRVPLAWTPPGRVFAGIELGAGVVFDVPTGTRLAAWGEWPVALPLYRASFRPDASDPGPAFTGKIPSQVRRGVASRREATVAMEAAGGLTVIPAAREPGGGAGLREYAVPRGLWELAAPDSGAAHGAVTLDRASTWRASEMTGVLVQGSAEAFARPETARGVRALGDRLLELGASSGRDAVLVRIHPRRAVWWRGWTSGTVIPG